MAVPSSDRALEVLRRLLGPEPVPYTELLRDGGRIPGYLPEGFEQVDPRGEGAQWLWTDPPPMDVGGYGDPERFALRGSGPAVWLAPDAVLPEGSGHTDAERQEYRRRSVDLAMRGGTTSGVVYPLAVCEIARQYRVRNVGGASAGAIAAAATAAAELGRSGRMLAPGRVTDARYSKLSDEDRRAGHVRSGFAGLSDLIAWLSQTDRDNGDLYRLAQLFRAGPETRDRRVFAVIVAVMRQRLWAVPVTALLAFGWKSKLALALLTVAGVLLTGWVGTQLSWPSADRAFWWGPLDLLLAFVLATALLTAAPLVRAKPTVPADRPKWLASLQAVSSRFERPAPRTLWPVAAVLVVVALVVAAAAGWWNWTAGLLVGIVLSTAMTIVVLVAVLAYLGKQHDYGYGLLAGAPEAGKVRRSLAEFLAGAPKPDVERGLVEWLGGCFSELAGLERDQVLRFGHLWHGPSFTPGGEQRGVEPRARLVNLQLVTTDLTRQRPYVFPLDPDGEELFFDPADLDGVFAEPVVAAMCATEQVTAGGRMLHRLPGPWDLPVVVAVRLSMALPGLFKAVRLYRRTPATTIRDDLGRAVTEDGKLLQSPPGAEELWFSDGGITSNFPVHLFDTLLPAWPTFGLNLGEHPEAFPHQDVWLPQDWQASRAPSTTVPRSLFGFVMTILDTARNWRDTMQTGMPGYRGRVAWVRQRPDEGGENLFMPREIIASMALRGALAGARLSRRFANPAQWTRYRWLRLRIGLDNAQQLRHVVHENAPAYEDLLASADAMPPPDEAYPYDPWSAGIKWYEPADRPAFWKAATGMLADVARDPTPTHVLAEGSPRPHPNLSQIPPM
ncbi:patatin-like phospholipase family protein [Dactylosporangium sp. AC04546]|uniref:patatin-like phospholipase family protein n=1 Tax=Dactylosporangium sp. AC04546 TaxID=2862460 RepID=UPI0027E09813|nr:patatin-like phospholipase family protein [Dactylosporangium sp. AC04546]WVK88316.1 patatin-like phospholipase family protein [Dactylosporangium sp. AC04546]